MNIFMQSTVKYTHTLDHGNLYSALHFIRDIIEAHTKVILEQKRQNDRKKWQVRF